MNNMQNGRWNIGQVQNNSRWGIGRTTPSDRVYRSYETYTPKERENLWSYLLDPNESYLEQQENPGFFRKTRDAISSFFLGLFDADASGAEGSMFQSMKASDSYDKALQYINANQALLTLDTQGFGNFKPRVYYLSHGLPIPEELKNEYSKYTKILNENKDAYDNSKLFLNYRQMQAASIDAGKPFTSGGNAALAGTVGGAIVGGPVGSLIGNIGGGIAGTLYGLGSLTYNRMTGNSTDGDKLMDTKLLLIKIYNDRYNQKQLQKQNGGEQILNTNSGYDNIQDYNLPFQSMDPDHQQLALEKIAFERGRDREEQLRPALKKQYEDAIDSKEWWVKTAPISSQYQRKQLEVMNNPDPGWIDYLSYAFPSTAGSSSSAFLNQAASIGYAIAGNHARNVLGRIMTVGDKLSEGPVGRFLQRSPELAGGLGMAATTGLVLSSFALNMISSSNENNGQIADTYSQKIMADLNKTEEGKKVLADVMDKGYKYFADTKGYTPELLLQLQPEDLIATALMNKDQVVNNGDKSLEKYVTNNKLLDKSVYNNQKGMYNEYLNDMAATTSNDIFESLIMAVDVGGILKYGRMAALKVLPTSIAERAANISAKVASGAEKTVNKLKLGTIWEGAKRGYEVTAPTGLGFGGEIIGTGVGAVAGGIKAIDQVLVDNGINIGGKRLRLFAEMLATKIGNKLASNLAASRIAGGISKWALTTAATGLAEGQEEGKLYINQVNNLRGEDGSIEIPDLLLILKNDFNTGKRSFGGVWSMLTGAEGEFANDTRFKTNVLGGLILGGLHTGTVNALGGIRDAVTGGIVKQYRADKYVAANLNINRMANLTDIQLNKILAEKALSSDYSLIYNAVDKLGNIYDTFGIDESKQITDLTKQKANRVYMLANNNDFLKLMKTKGIETNTDEFNTAVAILSHVQDLKHENEELIKSINQNITKLFADPEILNAISLVTDKLSPESFHSLEESHEQNVSEVNRKQPILKNTIDTLAKTISTTSALLLEVTDKISKETDKDKIKSLNETKNTLVHYLSTLQKEYSVSQLKYDNNDKFVNTTAFDLVRGRYDMLHQLRAYAKALRDTLSIETISDLRDKIFDTSKREKLELDASKNNLKTAYQQAFDKVQDAFKDVLQFNDKDDTDDVIDKTNFLESSDKEKELQQNYRDLIFTKLDTDLMNTEESNLYDGITIDKDGTQHYSPTKGDTDLGKEMIRKYNALWNGEEYQEKLESLENAKQGIVALNIKELVEPLQKKQENAMGEDEGYTKEEVLLMGFSTDGNIVYDQSNNPISYIIGSKADPNKTQKEEPVEESKKESVEQPKRTIENANGGANANALLKIRFKDKFELIKQNNEIIGKLEDSLDAIEQGVVKLAEEELKKSIDSITNVLNNITNFSNLFKLILSENNITRKIKELDDLDSLVQSLLSRCTNILSKLLEEKENLKLPFLEIYEKYLDKKYMQDLFKSNDTNKILASIQELTTILNYIQKTIEDAVNYELGYDSKYDDVVNNISNKLLYLEDKIKNKLKKNIEMLLNNTIEKIGRNKFKKILSLSMILLSEVDSETNMQYVPIINSLLLSFDESNNTKDIEELKESDQHQEEQDIVDGEKDLTTDEEEDQIANDNLQTVLQNSKILNEYDLNRIEAESPRGNRFKVVFDKNNGIVVYRNASNLLPERGDDSNIDKAKDLRKYLLLNIDTETAFEETIKKYSKNDAEGRKIALSYVKYRFLPSVIDLIVDQLTNTIQNKPSIIISNNIRDAIKRIFNKVEIKLNDSTIKPEAFNKLLLSRNKILDELLAAAGWNLVASNVDLVGVLNGVNVFKNAEFLFLNDAGEFMIMNPTVSYKQMLRYDQNTKKYVFTSNYNGVGSFKGERFSLKEYDLANADQFNELAELILPGVFKKYSKLFIKLVKERDTNVVEDIDYIVASVIKNFVSQSNLHVGDSADILTNSLLKQYNTFLDQLKVDLSVLKEYYKNLPISSPDYDNIGNIIKAAEQWSNYSLTAEQLKSNDIIQLNTNNISEVLSTISALLLKFIDQQKLVSTKKLGRSKVNPSVLSTVSSAIDKVDGYDKLVQTKNDETTPLFNTGDVKLLLNGEYKYSIEVTLNGKSYIIPLYVDLPSRDGHIESLHKTLLTKLTKMFDFIKVNQKYTIRPNNISLSLGEFIDEHDKNGNPVLKTLTERGLVTKDQLYTIIVDGSLIGVVNSDNTVVDADGKMIAGVAKGINNQKLIAGLHVFFFNSEKYNGKKTPKKIWTKVMPQSVIDLIPILIKDKYYSTILHENALGIGSLLDCMIFSGNEDTLTTDLFVFRFYKNDAFVSIGSGKIFDVTSENFIPEFTDYIHSLQKDNKNPYMPHFRVGDNDANTVLSSYRKDKKMYVCESEMFKYADKFFKEHPNIDNINIGTGDEAFTLFKRSLFDKNDGRFMTGLGWFIDSGIMLSTYDGAKNKLINTSDFHVYDENGNQIDDSKMSLPSTTNGIEETRLVIHENKSEEDILSKIKKDFGSTKVLAIPVQTEEELIEESKQPELIDELDLLDEEEVKQSVQRANKFKKNNIFSKRNRANYESTISSETISKTDQELIINKIQKIIGRTIPVIFHSGIIESFSNGASVLGQCMVDSIVLSDKMIPGVEYHEAFHRIVGLTLKENTRNSLYKYYIKKSGLEELSDKSIEEGLSDMYMSYKNDSSIKLSFNLKSFFNSISNFCKFIKEVGSFKLIRTFLLTDFGWYANKNISEENIKHFTETFGNVARYSIYDDKSKTRVDIGDSFVNFTQFYDLIKGIVNTIIRDQKINGVTIGVDNMDLSLNTILGTMMKDPNFSKFFDKNDPSSKTEMANSIRQLFTGTTIVTKLVYNKSTKLKESVEKEFPIWDVVKLYIQDYVKSLNQNIIINELRHEESDKKENEDVEDTGILNYEKTSYEVNPLTRVSQKVKFLCATFAKYKTVKNGRKITYVLDTEDNVYGFPTMHSVNEVYVKLVKAFNKCKGLDDLNTAINKRANSNDIMFQFARFWNSVYKNMFNSDGTINYDVRNQLVQIQLSLAQVINSYYICQMSQTSNKNNTEYQFNFFDTRINTYAKDYGMNIYASVLKGNYYITSEQTSSIDEETGEKIFKRKFTSTGKLDIQNTVKYLNDFVKVINGEKAVINGISYDIGDITSLHSLLDGLCETLKLIGIPIASNDVLEYIYLQYELVSNNTITDDSILCEQITNFIKNVSGINDFKKNLARLNNRSEYTNINNILKLYFSRFIRTLGTAIAIRQLSDQSFSTLALGGKRIYNISQPCLFTLITDDINDRNSKLWDDINTNRLASTVDDETGERRGCVILKRLESDEDLMLSPIVINGFKTSLPYDKGSEFKREGTIENILNRFIAISRGCILSPTMSDKTTWFAIKGIQLPGFEYPMYGDNSGVIVGNAPKIFFLKNGSMFLSITNNNVIDQFKLYIECELASVKFNNSSELKKFFKEHPELKIANYHGGNLGGNSTRFRTFCEYYEYQIDEEKTKELNKLVYKKDADGNLIEKTIIVNDTNKTSDLCIKIVENVLNKYQDKKLQNQYIRMIVSNIVRHAVEDCLQELSDGGIIDTKDGISKAKNVFLDATLINRLKGFRSDATSNINQDTYAIYAYLQDIIAKNIMGVTEFERLYIVNPAFYKWKYKNNYLSDAQSDEYKRLGAFVSTGDQNCELLNGIPSHYRCLLLSDEFVTSDEVNGVKLKDLFYNSNLRDVYTQRLISPITELFYRDRSKITTLLEKAYDALQDTNDAKEIGQLTKLVLSLLERINKLESDYKTKCSEIYDKVYSKNESNEYDTKLSLIESEDPELAETIRKKSTREVDEHFVHRNGTADSGICVTDATSFISPTMAKNLLLMRGAYSDDIDTAFKILEGEIEVSPEDLLDAEHLIEDALIVIGKYSAAGYRMENNQMINYYNKTALAILTKHSATGRLAKLYLLMHDGVDVDEIDTNTGLNTGKKVHKQIDMMMFDSAVKAGSRASVSVNDKGELIGIDGKEADLSKYSYEQPYRNIRHQLNTDPNEKEKMKLGTLTMKIVQSNLRLYKRYNSIFKDGLGEITGEGIRDRINDNINALTDIHAQQVLSELGSPFKLRLFLKKQLTSRGADLSIIETLNDLSIPIESLSNRKFIESVIISEIGKNVIDTNLGGKAFILKTSFGAEGGKVIDDESYPSPLYGGRRLLMINNKNSMDICVTMDYLDPIIKGFVGKLKFEEMTFDEKKKLLLDKNLIGYNADPFILGYRIPTLAESSIHSMRIADILPDTFDTIMVPREFTVITGSDFDVDKLFLIRHNINTKAESKEDIMKFEEGSEEYYENDLLNLFRLLLTDIDNSVHILYRSIDDDTTLMKDFGLLLPDLEKPHVPSFGMGYFMKQVRSRMAYQTGKAGIAPYALNNNNLIITQLYLVVFKTDSKRLLETLNMNDLSRVLDREDQLILSWLSCAINLHVDLVKDPVVTKENINTFTYNMSNLFIRTGHGKVCMSFLNQPSIRLLAKKFMNETSSKIKGLRNKTDILNECIDYVRNKITEGNDTEYKHLINWILGKHTPSNTDIEKYPFMGEKDARDSYLLSKFKDLIDGEYFQNVISKGINLNDVIGKDSLTLVSSNDNSITVGEIQALSIALWDKLSPYADNLASLVKYSKIETKKYGSNFGQIFAYMYGYNKFRDKNKFDTYTMDKLFDTSYLDNKTTWLFGILSSILLKECIAVNSNVLNWINQMLLIMFKDRSDISADYLSLLIDSISAIKKSRFFYDDRESSPKGYVIDNNISVRELFYGNNTVLDIYNELNILAHTDYRYFDLLSNALFERIIPIDTGDSEKPKTLTIANTDANEAQYLSTIKRGFEMLCSDIHPEVRLFANKLAVYAYYTSGDNGGFGSIMRFVSEEWRSKQGMTQYVKNVLKNLGDDRNSGDVEEDISDIIANCRDCSIIAPLKKLTNKKDGSSNFISLKADSKYGNIPVLMINASNKNGYVSVPSTQNDPVITIQINVKNHVYATYKAVGTVKMIFNGKPVEYTIYGLKRPSSIKTDKNITIYSFNSDMKFNPYEVDPLYYADSLGFGSNVLKLIDTFSKFMDRTLTVGNITDELYRQFEGSESTVDITDAKVDMFLSKGSFDFNDSFFKRFPLFDKLKDYIKNTKTNSPAETYLKLLSYLTDPKLSKNEDSQKLLKEFRKSGLHLTNKEYIELFDGISKYIDANVVTDEFATKLATFIINRYANSDANYKDNILSTGNSKLIDNKQEINNEYIDVLAKAIENTRRRLLNNESFGGLEQKEDFDEESMDNINDIKQKITEGILNNTLETKPEEGKNIEDLCGVGSKTNEIGAGADFLKSLRKKK